MSKKSKINKIFECISQRKSTRIATLCIVSIILIIYPFINSVVTVEQLVGIITGVAIFMFWHLDSNISTISSDVERYLHDNDTELTLTKALGRVAEIKREWEEIRIFATSTGQFYPIMKAENIQAKRLVLIVREISTGDKKGSPKMRQYTQVIDNHIDQWKDRERLGEIGNFEHYRLSGFPIEYHAIFDDNVLLSEMLAPDLHDPSEVHATGPLFLRNSTPFGASQIIRHKDRFDKPVDYIRTNRFKDRSAAARDEVGPAD